MRRSFLRKLGLIRPQKGFLGDKEGGRGEKQATALDAPEFMLCHLASTPYGGRAALCSSIIFRYSSIK